MKKKILFILCICFFLFSLSNGNTADVFKVNGYDWQDWSKGSRISFVGGWVKCGVAASDNLFLEWNQLNEAIERSDRQVEIYKDEGILFGGVTIGQIVDTIDKLYSDPRLKLMDISEVMPLVSGRLIQGWTEKELDEVIAINVKLKQCEGKEKKPGELISEECGSLMKEKNSYLQKLKKK